MNDEIKEILDILKNCKDYDDEVFLIKQHSATLLLNYITNLQQDNEMYAQLKDEYEEEIKDLQQENERLKEENNNKAMNDYAHAIDESWYRELYDDYKSRCKKAIEYIKSYNLPENLGHLGEAPISIRELRDLLNILQNGSDDNE